MSWQAPEARQGRYERAERRRALRLERYRQTHPERVRHFPHDPFRPRLVPGPARDRQSNQKLFGWQVEGIRAAVAFYLHRPEEFQYFTVGKGRKNRVKLWREGTARSEKAELIVRLIVLMLVAVQRDKGANFEKYEVGSYRNGRLWRWTLPQIADHLGEGEGDRPSIDQIGDAFNCMAASKWVIRRQPSGSGPAMWKMGPALLDVLGVSKRFGQSAGLDQDLEYYLSQVHGEHPELQKTADGRSRALMMAAKRQRAAGKARPPPT